MTPSLPWLTEPVELHSWREAPMCMLTPEQCAYQRGYWRWWYQADYRYALPTVAFFMATIIVFTIAHFTSMLAPESLVKSSPWRRCTALVRNLSYRRWRIGGWMSQSLGTYLLGGVGFVFFAAMTLGPKPYYWQSDDFGSSPPIATRAGWMALACLPFVLILSTKANPIATLTGISHEHLIVWHNWIAWAMFVLALVHTFPFVVYNIKIGGITHQWSMGGLWVTGTIALVAQAWLTFFSIRWLRERFYETFKATHFLAAILFVVFFFLHCDHVLSSWDYFIAASCLYVSSWLYSQSRVFLQHGVRRARISLASPDTLRITIDATTTWAPGQHVYLRFLTQGLHVFTSSPFTICSLATTKQGGKQEMVFYVRVRKGFTRRLARMAAKSPEAAVPVLLDGPYGGVGHKWAEDISHIVAFGGGAGAGFVLALAQDFLRRTKDNVAGSPTMSVSLASRDSTLKSWFTSALIEAGDDLSYNADDVASRLRLEFHDTSENAIGAAPSQNDMRTPSDKEAGGSDKASEQSSSGNTSLGNLSKGRPDIRVFGRKAVAEHNGKVGLIVCGPASMVDDVASVAASAQANVWKKDQGAAEVWFHTETFS